MKRHIFRYLLGGIIIIITIINAQISFAEIVYINDFQNYPIYNYNTSAYMQNGAYVGCGPTTAAMIFGYIDARTPNTFNFLTNNNGLDTANSLHGSTYMNTDANGFGSQYNIESGIEKYAADRPWIINSNGSPFGFEAQRELVNVMLHVSPTNTSPNSTWDTYGPFQAPGPNYPYYDSGPVPSFSPNASASWRSYAAWTNDANFYYQNSSGWHINDVLFENWALTRLQNSIPIMLTVDSNGDGSGDHWIPMVGYDSDTHKYAYYNTYDLNLHWADIAYVTEEGSGAYGISAVRDVIFSGVGLVAMTDQSGNYVFVDPVPEPSTFLLLGVGLGGLVIWRRKKVK
jgi:hypothetical protein